MNKNQKIAIGCGAAGCLGLIVIAVACAIAYVVYQRRPAGNDSNHNSSFSRNQNRRASSGSDNSSSSSSSRSSGSSMSEDDKHKLFQAAGMTKDNELIQKVLKKLGFMNPDGTTTGEYEQFVKDHFEWALRNVEFVGSVNTPEKARAYVNEHIDD